MPKNQKLFLAHSCSLFLFYCSSPQSQPVSQVEDLPKVTKFSGRKKKQTPSTDYFLKVTLAKVRRGWLLLNLPLARRTCPFVFSIKLGHFSYFKSHCFIKINIDLRG